MKRSRILITGASGCVGQYISYWLLNNSDTYLYLWLRDTKKLTSINANHPRIKILEGDIRDPIAFKEDLRKINRVIHTATAWGNPKRANEVNIIAVKNMLNFLDPKELEQIIYFSTASILNKDLEPIPEAMKYGTEYIQTKAKCLQDLEEHYLSDRIIAVFPTLVFGGKINQEKLFPTSYLTQGLSEAVNWLWIARWFKAYSRFHFIHAKDIAFVCGHLVTTNHIKNIPKNGRKIKYLVLAQPSLSIDIAIDELLSWKGMRSVPRIPLWGWLIEALIRFLPIKLNSWDRFSIKQRHFDHNEICNPESFGARSNAKTIREIFADSGLTQRK